MMSVKFEDLLESVSNGDVEKLQAKRSALQAERTKLQTNLAKVNRELSDIEFRSQLPSGTRSRRLPFWASRFLRSTRASRSTVPARARGLRASSGGRVPA